MTRKKGFTSALVLGLLLALAAGITLAQEPKPEGGVQPQGDLSVTGSVASTISYQGMLTENDSPVDGSRNMIFRLYSDSACSTQVGSDIDVGSVQVNDGFFDVDLAVDQDDFNGQSLWLEAEVGGATIGCEAILPVPYALSLRPGATISVPSSLYGTPNLQGGIGSAAGWELGDVDWSGMPPMVSSIFGIRGNASGGSLVAYGVEGSAESTDGTAYGVYGNATATEVGGTSYGVYGLGNDYGVYGLSTSSNGGVGMYGYADASSGLNYGVYGRTDSPDGYGGLFVNTAGGADIKAAGSGIIQSTAETEIAVSPLKMVQYYDSDVVFRPTLGYMEIRPSTTGWQDVYVPVDLPSIIFGTGRKLESVRVCYKLDNANSYIDLTGVNYMTDAGSYTVLVDDDTHRTSTGWECYTVVDASPAVIDGSLTVAFRLDFDGTGSLHDIRIGNITLTLVE